MSRFFDPSKAEDQLAHAPIAEELTELGELFAGMLDQLCRVGSASGAKPELTR